MSHSDAPKYNWNQPRYFDRNQMETIAAFAKNVADDILVPSLASLGRSDCTAVAADIVQRFASDLLTEFAAQPQFCAAITTDKNEPCGFISRLCNIGMRIDRQTARRYRTAHTAAGLIAS